MSQTQVETAEPAKVFELRPYVHVPESSFLLDWADLVTLDLSQFDAPGGKEKLAAQLFDAIRRIGFFYIINFGLSQEQIDRQYVIGQELLALPLEEKMKYAAKLDAGDYNRYKPAGVRELAPGVFENNEQYNIPKFTPDYEMAHPEVLKPHWAEIEKFSRHIHFQIVEKLLVLFAIIMELPEDYFVQRHKYEERSDCYLRYLKYHARTPEDNVALNNVWLNGHTDFGSLTLLFRQPIAALQVKTPEGKWKYVKPYPESLTVNTADTLEFLSGGFLKSSIHRVVAPPPDQAHLDRFGVLYFVRPNDDVELKGVLSPVMEREGVQPSMVGKGLTTSEWVKARVAKNIGNTKHGANRELNIVKGVQTKYYDDPVAPIA